MSNTTKSNITKTVAKKPAAKETTAPVSSTKSIPVATEQSATGLIAWEPALESRLVTINNRQGLFIGGRFVAPRSRKWMTSTNPATGEVLAEVADAGAADVAAAVAAARAAFGEWSETPGIERGKVLFRLARLVAERGRELAVLETLDGGKPIRESRDVDVPLAAQHLFSQAGWADKLAYAGLGTDPRPIGVCAQIIPWNFPLLMAAWKIGPALACGNTVVLKPAETTSLSALKLAELCQEAGVPDGVVNIITGGRGTGAALVAAEGIDKIAFTGSTQVGREIAAECARRGLRSTMELGGKGANIVFADAPLDDAVEGIVAGIFFNQGHVCCAGSRLLIHESVHDEFISLLTERMAKIRVGDPMDKNTDMGAINSAEQLDRIASFIDQAAYGGAEIITVPCAIPAQGQFMLPTVVTGVGASDAIVREEVFGPVLTVQTFRTADEAIKLANNTPYGLACGIWTRTPGQAALVASSLQAGVIWTNTYNVFDPTAPFGGMKLSGWGREGGRSGLEAYCA